MKLRDLKAEQLSDRNVFLVLHLETLFFLGEVKGAEFIRHIKIWFYELYMNLHERHKYFPRFHSQFLVSSKCNRNFTLQCWREITQGSSLRDRPMTARAGCEDNESEIKLGTTRHRWMIVYLATIHNRTHFVVCNKVLSRITSPIVGEGLFFIVLLTFHHDYAGSVAASVKWETIVAISLTHAIFQSSRRARRKSQMNREQRSRRNTREIFDDFLKWQVLSFEKKNIMHEMYLIISFF